MHSQKVGYICAKELLHKAKRIMKNNLPFGEDAGYL
jgi:hypothetical protein